MTDEEVPEIYNKIYAVSKNWHLLTGKKREIYRLARCSFNAEKDLGFTKDNTEFLHTEHLVLVYDMLWLGAIYNTTLKPDIIQLKQDVTQLSEK